MADQVFATIFGRVRTEPREITGNNDKGPYSFRVVEVLDGDDNKREVTLPDNCPPLSVGAILEADCEFSVRHTARGSFLSVSAKAVKVVDAKTGEIRKAS